jgi:hypothetical protein
VNGKQRLRWKISLDPVGGSHHLLFDPGNI